MTCSIPLGSEFLSLTGLSAISVAHLFRPIPAVPCPGGWQPRQTRLVSLLRPGSVRSSFNDDRAELGYRSEGRPSCDYSVGSTWAKDDTKYYLLDLVRIRASYPDLVKVVRQSIDEHNPDIVLIEDAGAGSSLIADLDSQAIATTPVKARIDKESRLIRAAAMIENGSVYLPKDAHWKDDFILEVLAFPNGRHDDQVDSMSQALIWMKDDKPTGGFYIGKC